jgi:SAM-dependent methyltransferase
MAHIQQAFFCESVKQRFPQYFKNRFVLDIGSLDINGNNQFLFDSCLYLGIDLAQGRNVDLISKGHELALPDASVDIIVSTECFEHDQFYERTLQNIVRMVKPGGLFLFTCATTGRLEHGTRRTTPQDAPFIQDVPSWSDYYKNLEEEDIRKALDLEQLFSTFEFSKNDESKDLYFWGIKKGELVNRIDYSFQIGGPNKQIEQLKQKHDDDIKQIEQLKQKHDEDMLLIHSLQKESVVFRTKLHEHEVLIQSLQRENTILNEHIQTYQIALNDSQTLVIKYENELESAVRAHAAMKEQKDAVEIMLSKIHRSLSWKLTIPVRVAGRLIRGEFRLIWSAIRARLNSAHDSHQHK